MVPGITARLRRRPSAPSSPPLDRHRRAWWRDLRVVAGVVLILGCAVVGVRVLAADAETVAVWRVTRDLAAGTIPVPGDLERIDLPPLAAAPYVSAEGPPTVPLARDLRAGELVPRDATAGTPAVRWVTIPVEPLHAPIDLAAGDRVDVWATGVDDFGVPLAPREVLAGVLVAAVAADALGLGGEIGVVVEVAPGDVGALLGAVRGRSVDLVRAPVAAASP